MKNGVPFRVLRSFATLVFALALGGATALAQTHTWDGGSVTTNNWSDSGNWDAVGVPAQPGAGVANIVFGGLARLRPTFRRPTTLTRSRSTTRPGRSRSAAPAR